MEYSYRITKYKYLSFSGRLRSPSSEWTSFSEFDGADDLRMKEYLSVENEYISLALFLCKSFGVGNLRIKELEKNNNTEDDIYEGALFSVSELPRLVGSILRESFWCKLIGDDIEFHFGYDYYMYFVSNKDACDFILNSGTKLFTQEYLSPYMID